MNEQLKEKQAVINDFYYCIELPGSLEKKKSRRKQSPAMINEAIIKHSISKKKSFLIGDKKTDLNAAQNAKIKGEINTNELIINGFVSGTIRSKKVTLTSSAKVEGDIIHNTIAIETGAHFEGSIEKTDNPLLKSDLKNGKLIN